MTSIWDERYRDHPHAFGTAPNDFLVATADRLPRDLGPVLCIGDGQGRNGVFLAEQGFEVISMDLSAVGMAAAAELATTRGVPLRTIVADLATFEPPAPLGAVVSIFCHLPSAIRRVTLPRLVGALAPGGVWLQESYAPEQIGRGTGGPSDPDLLPAAWQVISELTPLVPLLAREAERSVVEGAFHTGDASVVQYLGRKALGTGPDDGRAAR